MEVVVSIEEYLYMKNSDKFLSIYNKLDNYLRDLERTENYVSFSSIVNRLSKNRREVRQFKKKLFEYNDLRNAIVHERIDNMVIAEPNDFAVNDFERIYKKISSPDLITRVVNHHVKTLDIDDMLTDALIIMQENDFSQIPVYKGNEFIDMLNTEAITSWMKSSIAQEIVSITEMSIREILKHKSDYTKTVFKPRKINVYEIMDIYKKNVYEPKQIDAIIITHNGRKDEKPLTIITDFDIPLILEHF